MVRLASVMEDNFILEKWGRCLVYDVMPGALLQNKCPPGRACVHTNLEEKLPVAGLDAEERVKEPFVLAMIVPIVLVFPTVLQPLG